MSEDIRYKIVDYLTSQGWNVILIDNHGIQKSTNVPYRYEYTKQWYRKSSDNDGKRTL